MPPILLAAGLAGGCVLTAGFSFVASGKPAIDSATGAADYNKLKGVLLVTLGFAYLLESGLGGQVMVNSMRDMKPKPDETNAANRGFHNSFEHAMPALIFIWTHALLVNSNTAALLGGVYVTARFAYGFLFGAFGGFTIAVEPCTEFCCTPAGPLCNQVWSSLRLL